MKLLTLLLLIATASLNAQTHVIKGLLKNDKGERSASSTISLYRSADTVLVKVALSDSAGSFALKSIASGNYFIRIKAIGMQPYQSASIAVKADTDLGTISLITRTEVMSTVEVKAQKPLVEVLTDKTVFNVAGSLASTGLSAFDVLRKAPGVIVDNQNNLIVEGKAGVRIFIDGRVSMLGGDDLVNYLKTLQSSDIEAIEIITQPSAKYDAAGSAGIINIRLKKNQNYGTNGSVSGGYAVGMFAKYNAAASINHRTQKWNVFAGFSGNKGKNRGYINFNRFQNGYQYDQRSHNISDDGNYNLRGGIYYTASSTSTFALVASTSTNRYDNTGNSTTPISNLTTQKLEQILSASGFTANRNRNISTSFNYRYADKNRREFTIDADYGVYSSDRNNLQPNSYLDVVKDSVISRNIFRMITPVDIQLISVKADYTQPIGKAMFSAGIKTSLVQTDNTLNFFDVVAANEIFNTIRSNRFNYREQINALHASISRSWKKISVQMGLRAEQTISQGELISSQQNKDDLVKRNYVNLFPAGGLTWSADKKNSFAINYSRRIERPDYRSLNPFEYNIDELSYSKGNPYLQPQYVQTVKVSHTFMYTLVTGISYSSINNFFAQITDTSGSRRNFISPQNIANQRVLNLSISYPFRVSRWWNVYASVNGYRSSYESANPKFVPITQHSLSLYGQNNFTLPAGFRFEVSGWFSSPSIWAGTYRTASLGSLDIALQKSILKNTLSLRAAISDLLYTSNWSGTTQYGNLYIKGNGGYESRQLRVSLNYNFGKKTVKAATEKRSGAEEEKGRIN